MDQLAYRIQIPGSEKKSYTSISETTAVAIDTMSPKQGVSESHQDAKPEVLNQREISTEAAAAEIESGVAGTGPVELRAVIHETPAKGTSQGCTPADIQVVVAPPGPKKVVRVGKPKCRTRVLI